MRALIRALLRRRLILTLLALSIVGVGYDQYLRLPVEAFPDVSPNLVQVFTVTEGLAPEEVERYVTYPIEVAMNGLPQLRLIRSVSNFGLSVVSVYFEDGADPYLARQLVSERLRLAKDQIPEGFGKPQLGPISTSMGLVLFYNLRDRSGRRSLLEMRTLQEWVVGPMLRTVPGVTEVLGIGGWEKQYHVVVRPEDLLRYGVTIQEVLTRLRENNASTGAQFIERGSEEYLIRVVGLATGTGDLKRIVIKTDAGTPVYLHQVATVGLGGAVRRGLQTRNGREEVVAGMVVKLHGTNATTVIALVEEQIRKINRALPPGVEMVPYYEQKTLIQASVRTVYDALVQGIVLVILVLALFLGGVRPSLVAVFSIPFSVLFAVLGLRLLGMTANLMTLGGLAIAIGMIVDGAIVIVDNVERALRGQGASPGPEGQGAGPGPAPSRRDLVVEAAAEVVRPILFAISIIVIVFIPLFALEGVEGKTFRPLAIAVALAMLGSLVYAVFFAPVFAHLLLGGVRRGPGRGDPHSAWPVVAALRARVGSALERGRHAWTGALDRGLGRGYRPLVRFFVGHRAVSVGLSLGLLALGGLGYSRLGSEFTPTLQEGTIVLRLTMAPSISLEASKQTTLMVERRVMRVPEVAEVISRIGRGEVGAHTDPVNSAEMYIVLRPRSAWRGDWSQKELEEVIRKAVGDVPGVATNFTQPIQMTLDELMEGVRAELAIKLFGDDLEVLRHQAERIAAVVRGVPGAADVQVDQVIGQPQLLIQLDRKAIARWGLNIADVQQVVSAAVGGAVAGQIFEGVRRFDILVRYPPEHRSTQRAIEAILITTPRGAKVPLSQLATVRTLVGPRQITRENTSRFISVQCNVRGRDIGSFVHEAEAAIARQVTLPPGYYVTWGGQYKLQQEANRRLLVVIPITLGLILVMLYLTFNRVRDVLLIAVNIPLALVGGVVALWVTGQNLSVPASVGFIALFGIAVENGLVLVTVMNQRLAAGLAPREAAVQGALQRLRPVLMTALTTALGLIPLLVARGTGSEIQRPLATVVTGGLATATLLTLLVVPALYGWLAARPGSRAPGG